MGTSLGDSTHYMSGLAHTAPPVPPRQQKWLDKRWSEWLPWATIESRKHSDPASALYLLKTVFHARVVSLLSAHIAWATIRKFRLDSPLESNEKFEFLLRAAIVRRRCRMGRVKGKVRKHA